ncbi:helix-turn-helix domain-containing protein [Lactococcus protaetiae]|uniref:helix-turn-helix domain-containing protein n=1 Tax=Lactococcus protaetiae TaxID=2592653 RepID=UPI001CC1E840
MNFGKNLKQLRINAKLTQSQLAEQLGMKQSAYVLWEQKESNPTLELLEKLSEIYGLSIEELIKKTDYSTEKQLLENYRLLTEEQQESVINFTDFLIEQNKSNIIELQTYSRNSLYYAIVEDEELSAGLGNSVSNTGGYYKAYTTMPFLVMMVLHELKENLWNLSFLISLSQHFYILVLVVAVISMQSPKGFGRRAALH